MPGAKIPIKDNFKLFKKQLCEQLILKAINKQNKDNKLIPNIYPIKKKLFNRANGKINKYTNGTEDINKRKLSLHGNLINNLNIPVIDIHEEFFMKQNDPISFYAHRIYGPYNPDGYHKVAETIVKKVNELK